MTGVVLICYKTFCGLVFSVETSCAYLEFKLLDQKELRGGGKNAGHKQSKLIRPLPPFLSIFKTVSHPAVNVFNYS